MAINWAHEPPPRRHLPHIPLKRLGANQRLRGAITSVSYLACWCHYLAGRTLPCVQHDCPGCELQRRRFRECYFGLWTSKPSEHMIVAVTASAELQLYDSPADITDLRGTIVELQRVGPKTNGRVKCQVTDERVLGAHLPPAPDLQAHLLYIWGITDGMMGAEHPLWAVREQLLQGEEPNHGSRLPPIDPNAARVNDSR